MSSVTGVLQAGDELRLHGDLAGLRVARADLDQAHAATAHHRQARMPAVVRDLDARQPRGLDAVEPPPGGNLDFAVVDEDGGHGGSG